MMKYIQLSGGVRAVVDDEDYEAVNQYKWHVTGGSKRYAQRHASTVGTGSRKSLFMHRVIIALDNGSQQVDHIDGNGLNNQRANLRVCTSGGNNRNKRKNPRWTESRFKGVRKHRSSKRWSARIKCDYQERHIGYFDTEVEAARAYDSAAKELFGEFANTNEMAGLYNEATKEDAPCQTTTD